MEVTNEIFTQNWTDYLALLIKEKKKIDPEQVTQVIARKGNLVFANIASLVGDKNGPFLAALKTKVQDLQAHPLLSEKCRLLALNIVSNAIKMDATPLKNENGSLALAQTLIVRIDLILTNIHQSKKQRFG